MAKKEEILWTEKEFLDWVKIDTYDDLGARSTKHTYQDKYDRKMLKFKS